MKENFISVIVPTYNERENIAVLIPRIFSSLENNAMRGEVIVVDDNSPDGTAEAAEKLGGEYSVRVLRRPRKEGLSSAVIAGIAKADGDVIGVIDADLSHPPEEIPTLARPVLEKKADITVASRYVRGGGIENWPVSRRIISRGAGLLAKPIANLKDPLSGFFFFRRSVIEGKELNPTGYKIGLEVIVKSGSKRVAEIPYIFHDRKIGSSKLGMKQNLEYLVHLVRLYWHKARQ
ncbi:MAG: polyprenol monophosphomannose synthase [Candidatus Aenigmarchaeota archaeon]|nr:polyprenol monophosphomannose synthase [Candidatus Aenigmarchaeota archaeon]